MSDNEPQAVTEHTASGHGDTAICSGSDTKTMEQENTEETEENGKPDREKKQMVTDINKEPEIQETVASMEKTAEKPVDDGFVSPISLPPIAKSAKKPDSKPVSLAFKSKFAIPADIYKSPRLAMFMAEMPAKPKKDALNEDGKASTAVEKVESKSSDKSKPKPPPAKLNYEPPQWSSISGNEKYSLEVLKMGSIVDQVKLSGKEYFLIGRQPDCDIKMEHPSISRYHAVLQYGAPHSDSANVELQKDGSYGFYVYDLGSTHGTIVNKHNIRSKTFYRIKVGHVVKFGGSTRLFILQGPSDDQEEESQESATELREINKKKIKKRKDLERMMLGEDSSSDEDDDSRRTKAQKNAESSGVTWGLLEDAVDSSSDEEKEEEEEGDSRADHPDAILVQTKKDPFYMKDPVKALKNLYEREKMELDFECNERRSGHWHVRLCLPVDGPRGKPVYSEVNATGKKKDTIRQCALEACRVLERHGLFHHKDHHKQKVKQWEKDDFYDSDEDEFHDRTGELEIKRNMRMQRMGMKSKSSKVVETYESLVSKVSDLDNEIKDIEARLQKDKEATKLNTEAVDPLDAFMQQVKSGKALDTTTRAKLKRRLFEARKEHMRVAKLADIARPSSLPPLASSTVKNYSFIGKMRGKKKPVMTEQVMAKPVVCDTTKKEEPDGEIEEKDDEEELSRPTERETKFVKLMDVKSQPEGQKSLIPNASEKIFHKKEDIERTEALLKTNIPEKVDLEEISENISQQFTRSESRNAVTAETETQTRKRVLGPALPPELKPHLLAESDNNPEQEVAEEEVTQPKRKKRRPRRPRQSNARASNADYSDDPKYSVWLPPEGQSGDGKTSLNEKLGY